MRHSLEPRSSINYTTHEYSRSANFRPESKSAIYSSAPQPDLGGAGPLLPPLPDQRSSQPSPPVPGAVKVGERLASKYDLSMVHPDDLPRVLDAITKVLSCETPMPEVKLTIQPDADYYAVLIKGFNRKCNWDIWYQRLRLNPQTRLEGVSEIGGNWSTGTFVMHVDKIGTANPMADPYSEYAQIPTSKGSSKRGRVDPGLE